MDGIEKGGVEEGSTRKHFSPERYPITEEETPDGVRVTAKDLHGGRLTVLIADTNEGRVVRLVEYVALADINEREYFSLELFGRVMDVAQEKGATKIEIPVDDSVPGARQIPYIRDIEKLLGETGAQAIDEAKEYYNKRENRRASDAYMIQVPMEIYQANLAQWLRDELERAEQ